MEVPTPIHLEDLDVSQATFVRPDLTTFAGLDGLGLEVVGQRVEPDRAVLACRVIEPDDWCHRCGCEGTPRDTVVACHEHGTAVGGFLPASWDHLFCQSWDHPARLPGGLGMRSLTAHVMTVDVEVSAGGIQGGQRG